MEEHCQIMVPLGLYVGEEDHPEGFLVIMEVPNWGRYTIKFWAFIFVTLHHCNNIYDAQSMHAQEHFHECCFQWFPLSFTMTTMMLRWWKGESTTSMHWNSNQNLVHEQKLMLVKKALWLNTNISCCCWTHSMDAFPFSFEPQDMHHFTQFADC